VRVTNHGVPIEPFLAGCPDVAVGIFATATLRYASRKYWNQLARDLKPIYTAPTQEAAWAAFEELEEKWGKPYPAITKPWRAAWEEFTPFLAYTTWRSDGSCSPPMRSSPWTRGTGGAITVRGHFPTEQAVLKTLCLVTRLLDPKAPARHAGRCGGSPPLTPSPSPSPTACPRPNPLNQ
jgi:transposase-like protein